MVVLEGHLHPQARAEFDQGPLDPATKLPGMTLMLKRSAAQQAALDQLLADQQNPASPQFHRWLTPEEFAGHFGYSPDDIAKIQTWLVAQGFTVDRVPKSRNWLVFSGTAEQVEKAFATSIHRYLVNGRSRTANAKNPSVPADLAPMVEGILGLGNISEAVPQIHSKSSKRPLYTNDSANAEHYLFPGDFAAIYDLTPLYNAGYRGAGQMVAVVGRCTISGSDSNLAAFRSEAGLPANSIQTDLVPGSQDPGNSNEDDCNEAYLDIEWAGGVAPAATVVYIYATNVWVAAQYAVENNMAPVLSMSFILCELNAGASFAAGVQSTAQQAAAQGITWVVSSGDSGAAGCDEFFGRDNTLLASNGFGVNVYASPSEVTGVGGTTFQDVPPQSYWSYTNDSSTGASALGYIPEAAWSITNDPSSAYDGFWASGGGFSQSVQRPSWQTGQVVSSQQWRAVPDVALSAAFHDGYRIVGATALGPGQFSYEAGTSAPTPSFAGILAILNEYWTKNGTTTFGQGNINPNLYQLAQTYPAAFHDVVSGDNNVPCVYGTPDCNSSGFLGYTAGPGYDLATGLGSVDAYNLVTQWTSNALPRANVTFTASPNPIPVSAGTNVGTTTLSWNAPGYSQLAVFLGSQNGAASGQQMTGTEGSSGSVTTGNWVTDGLEFFLVDLTTHNSVATLTVHLSSGGTTPPSNVTFTASPNPIPVSAGVTAGTTTLSWNAPSYTQLAIRLGSASGQQMTGTLGSSGSATTGNWVTDGLEFFLVDLTTNTTIANVTVHLTSSGTTPPSNVTFTASPNPIPVGAGATVGATTLSWNAPGYTQLAVCLNSANGQQMTGTEGSSGSATTGNWVTDGLQFFLVDLATHTAIANVTVHLATFTQLTSAASRDWFPVWRPDGTKILFSSNRNNLARADDIWDMDPDGSHQRELVHVDITTPSSWGDSGLAQNVKEFIGNTGDLAVLETQDYFEVMRVGLSSATSFPIVRTVWDGADTLFSQLLFVPGGLGVYGFVYSSITQNAAWIDAVSGQMQMRIAPFRQLSGQSSEEMGTVLLTTSSDGVTGGLAFAPNGQQLVASLCIASCSALNKGTDLFVLNAATGQVIQRLTTDGDAGISAVQPRWSPDGQWIVFVSNKSGNNEIWLIHPDGTGAEQVTANGLDNSGPSWSPDSKSLAFAINNNGAYSIWLASLRNGSTWPAISSLSPSSATAGGGAFKLSVAGFGFVSGSSVHWNGMSLPTTFVSAAQLAAQVSAAQIASQGTASVTVSNPGGATSAATFFSINSGSVITSLSPSSAKTGGGAFVPTVDGASFVSNSEVQWNGAAVPTASVNVARLNASVAASQIASPGAANITVLNPGRGSPPATAFLVNK